MASFSSCKIQSFIFYFSFWGVKCDVLWDSQEQALNEQHIWIFGLAEGGWGRVFLAEYGSCCSTLAEQCIVLDMINRCEQPAFNCLLLTWRCLTEGKESPLGLSKGVSGCRSVLHAGHACTFVPADATLIANSTQPLCKRCLFSFQGPKRSLCNFANENASSYTNLRQCVITCVSLQVILQEEHLLLSPTGNKCKLLFYGQLSLSGQLASWFRKVLNWYV